MNLFISSIFLLFLFGCENGSSPIGGDLPSAPPPKIDGGNKSSVKVQDSSYLIKYERVSYIKECDGSGVRVYSGTDTDGDKFLDIDEIFDQSYMCDGKNGINGSNGKDGVSGYSALMNFERQTYISECRGAGLLIVYGIDLNRDLLLDNDEIQKVSYLCDGQNSPEPDLQIVAIIYPCGKKPGEYNEILLKISNGEFITYLESGNSRHLAILDENTWYITTDKKKCTFKIVGGEIVYR